MVEIITYGLNLDHKGSDLYYQEVSAFSDTFLEYAEQLAGKILFEFQTHVEQKMLETIRTPAEYFFEYLTLGMLDRLYSAEAGKLPRPSQKILSWLFQARTKYLVLKPIIDRVRGILSGLLVRLEKASVQAQPNKENLEQLLKWMEATGEFSEETKRLALWASFLESLSTEKQTECLETARSLAEWFTDESKLALGKFTPNVDNFLIEKHPGYKWREDKFFCGRKREEYHLNMVGTEILNRSFREEFLTTDKKIILLPPCMQARQDGSCEAVETPFGDQCAHCTPGCRIHQISLLGDKYGFQVAIIPHELSVFSSGAMKAPTNHRVGIVGVSCPVTNVTGGWETKNLGVPAQGVLLDYCGCHWHWHDKGIPTEVNVKQLMKVISP
jgi:hypothetical protein